MPGRLRKIDSPAGLGEWRRSGQQIHRQTEVLRASSHGAADCDVGFRKLAGERMALAGNDSVCRSVTENAAVVGRVANRPTDVRAAFEVVHAMLAAR